MMQYTEPEMRVLDLNVEDIVATSIVPGPIPDTDVEWSD